MKQRRFIPALGYDLFTPLYDAGIRATMPELRFKRRLVESAIIEEGHRVLDVGCGTGTLLMLAAQRHPAAHLVGVDPDPRIVRRAQRKIVRRRLAIDLSLGSATALPFPDESFDRVLSSLVFHHLDAAEKRIAFGEICRVLRPGGEMHLADFGAPHNRLMSMISYVAKSIGHEHVTENFRGLLPQLAEEAGLIAVEETGAFATMFGTLRFLKGIRGR